MQQATSIPFNSSPEITEGPLGSSTSSKNDGEISGQGDNTNNQNPPLVISSNDSNINAQENATGERALSIEEKEFRKNMLTTSEEDKNLSHSSSSSSLPEKNEEKLSEIGAEDRTDLSSREVDFSAHQLEIYAIARWVLSAAMYDQIRYEPQIKKNVVKSIYVHLNQIINNFTKLEEDLDDPKYNIYLKIFSKKYAAANTIPNLKNKEVLKKAISFLKQNLKNMADDFMPIFSIEKILFESIFSHFSEESNPADHKPKPSSNGGWVVSNNRITRFPYIQYGEALILLYNFLPEAAKDDRVKPTLDLLVNHFEYKEVINSNNFPNYINTKIANALQKRLGFIFILKKRHIISYNYNLEEINRDFCWEKEWRYGAAPQGSVISMEKKLFVELLHDLKLFNLKLKINSNIINDKTFYQAIVAIIDELKDYNLVKKEYIKLESLKCKVQKAQKQLELVSDEFGKAEAEKNALFFIPLTKEEKNTFLSITLKKEEENTLKKEMEKIKLNYLEDIYYNKTSNKYQCTLGVIFLRGVIGGVISFGVYLMVAVGALYLKVPKKVLSSLFLPILAGAITGLVLSKAFPLTLISPDKIALDKSKAFLLTYKKELSSKECSHLFAKAVFEVLLLYTSLFITGCVVDRILSGGFKYYSLMLNIAVIASATMVSWCAGEAYSLVPSSPSTIIKSGNLNISDRVEPLEKISI